MRHHRDPRLILDEPTAAMDAEAEAQIFERLASLTEKQSALLISTLEVWSAPCRNVWVGGECVGSAGVDTHAWFFMGEMSPKLCTRECPPLSLRENILFFLVKDLKGLVFSVEIDWVRAFGCDDV